MSRKTEGGGLQLQLFQAAFEAAGEAIIITDADLMAPGPRIIYANDAFAAMSGYAVHEIIGKSPRILQGRLSDRATLRRLKEQLLRGESFVGETTNYRKDGDPVLVHFCITPVRDQAGDITHFVGVHRDVTALNQAQASLATQARYQGAIVELGKLGLEGAGKSVLFAEAVQRTAASMSAAHCAIFELQPDSRRLVLVAGTGFGDGLVGTMSTSSNSDTLCGYTFQEGRTVAVEDISSDERFNPHALLKGFDIVSAITTVIVGLKDTFGVLGVYWPQSRTLTNDDIAFVESVAHVIAASIQRNESDERVRQHVSKLDALRTIDIAIMGSLDLRVTLNVLLDQVVAQLGADAAAVLLLNTARQLEFASGKGFQHLEIRQARVSVTQSVAGTAIISRKAQFVADLSRPEVKFRRVEMLKSERFISYAVVPLIAKGEPQGVLEVYTRRPIEPDHAWLEFFEALAGQTAIAINNSRLFDALQGLNLDLTLAYDSTLEGWSRALDLRDKETEGHTLRVTEGTEIMARALGMAEDQIVHLRRGALLHDIGKMGIPDSILLKPGQLTEEEWEIMKMHPVYAYELLSPIPYLAPALDIPYCHHEKWDGTGYPRGLRGPEIPLVARLFAPVDIWDALRSNRPYRKGWSVERVRDHIRSLSGTHLDPNAVEIFQKCNL